MKIDLLNDIAEAIRGSAGMVKYVNPWTLWG